MGKIIILMFLTSCASMSHNWNEEFPKKTPEVLQKYINLVDYAPYPKNWFKGKENIPVIFGSKYSSYHYAICWESSYIEGRYIEINPMFWNNPMKHFNKMSYLKRDKFFKDMSPPEWTRYRAIQYALSYCVNSNQPKSIYKVLSF